jgi:tRNA (Thr-GGU) A37 N-methylase
LPGANFEHALDDLAGWEYLWVLFWFDRNPDWRPKRRRGAARAGRGVPRPSPHGRIRWVFRP